MNYEIHLLIGRESILRKELTDLDAINLSFLANLAYRHFSIEERALLCEKLENELGSLPRVAEFVNIPLSPVTIESTLDAHEAQSLPASSCSGSSEKL